MSADDLSRLHDGYAASYDEQVRAYGCHLADVLFGLCYEFIQPGQRLLDAGIGSGLAARLFVQAGMQVDGFDFSPAMLEVCRAKQIASELKLHDLTRTPWPYADHAYAGVVCCGVLHFIEDVSPAIVEPARLLKPSGWLALTSKAAAGNQIERHRSGDFTITAHPDEYMRAMLNERGFRVAKHQRCFGGEEIFSLWLAVNI